MKTVYMTHRFSASARRTITAANSIIAEYQRQGYNLTLRQLYYQYVSRDLIRNEQKEYKKLGDTISSARLAGEIDWDALEDRTRHLSGNSHWTEPASILSAAASSYAIDKWENQKTRVEVWIEKEALSGVFARICDDLDVPYFCCRGYVSQSEMWRAGMRHFAHMCNGQSVKVLHFGDHDPSGIDMTRDIADRLAMFTEQEWLNRRTDVMNGVPASRQAIREDMEAKGVNPVSVERLALNLDQIEQYNPPPNPAKTTDARAAKYIEQYGDDSWELDALSPAVLTQLARDAILAVRDPVLWRDRVAHQEDGRRGLEWIAENAERIISMQDEEQ